MRPSSCQSASKVDPFFGVRADSNIRACRCKLWPSKGLRDTNKDMGTALMTSPTSIVPISFERHGSKAFLRFSSYGFAASETVVPIVGAEVPKAALSFPLAFMKQGEEVVLMGLMGLEPGSNLFVGPDGRWIGTYVPAAIRGYPFILARTEEGRHVLCINEASGLVGEASRGERFFDDEGKATPQIQGVLDFLTTVHTNRAATARACQLIGELDVLQPWSIVVTKDGKPVNVEGLWRVSEEKLANLHESAFLELRKAGGLVLIYSQLLSMGHLPMLERLAGLKAQIEKQSKAPVPDNLDTIFGIAGQSQEIEIDWSKFKA